MRIIVAVTTALMGLAVFAPTSAQAMDRCANHAAGACTSLYLIESQLSLPELLRRQAYERGYRDGLRRYEEPAPPRRAYRDGRRGWPFARDYDSREYQAYRYRRYQDAQRAQSENRAKSER